MQYDGGVFPFKDKEFDVCWSNAVLEHVGGWGEQKLFLKEIKRVSRAAFITTPNRYFPFELHTRIFLLHYLPKRIFDKFLIKVGKKWASGDYLNLLSSTTLDNLLKECGFSGYKIIRNRVLWFTVNFMVIF